MTIGISPDGETVDLLFGFYPEYFMGDPVTAECDDPKPYISVIVRSDEGMRFMHDPAEVEAYCGAKMISYKYAEPIENSFG